MEHEGHHRSFGGLFCAAVSWAVLAGCGGDGGGGASRSPPLVAPEPPPSVRIQPTAVAESDEAAADALFRVTLTHSAASPVTVGWSTQDATALAGEDYEPAQGTLVFGPDVMEDVIPIRIIGDTLDEADEEFAVVLHGPVGASLESDRAMATIADDDDTPRLSIEGGKTSEGDGLMTFKVHLSEPSRRTVRVHFETRGGGAIGGSDFEDVSGTLVFDPGVKLQHILVPVANDRSTEAEEDFFAILSAPENADIAGAEARALIGSSDERPAPEEPEPPRAEPPRKDGKKEPKPKEEKKEKEKEKEKEEKKDKKDEDPGGDLEDGAEDDGGVGEVDADGAD